MAVGVGMGESGVKVLGVVIDLVVCASGCVDGSGTDEGYVW